MQGWKAQARRRTQKRLPQSLLGTPMRYGCRSTRTAGSVSTDSLPSAASPDTTVHRRRANALNGDGMYVILDLHRSAPGTTVADVTPDARQPLGRLLDLGGHDLQEQLSRSSTFSMSLLAGCRRIHQLACELVMLAERRVHRSGLGRRPDPEPEPDLHRRGYAISCECNPHHRVEPADHGGWAESRQGSLWVAGERAHRS